MKNARWTDEDMDFLEKHYKVEGAKWCAEKLERTLDAVKKRANDYGIVGTGKRGRVSTWTEEEEKFLIENYTVHGPKWCAEKLSKNIETLRSKAKAMGIIPKHELIWTEDKDEFVIKHYGLEGVDWVAKKLGVSKAAVRTRANIYGAKSRTYGRWVKWKEQALIENIHEKGIEWCMEKLEMPREAIQAKLELLGIEVQED